MFKFNFSNENEDNHEEKVCGEPNGTWLESEEITASGRNSSILRDIFVNCEENAFSCGDVAIKYFSTIDVLNVLRTSDESDIAKKLSVINADQNHSDLRTAVYEGGLKIWECTFDLLNYLAENKIPIGGKKVLDLGCGVGLLGLLSLHKGSSCTFQDYNSEILQYITIPNVKLNEDSYLAKSNFYSGDWQSFTNLLNTEDSKNKFDYIFTSETIYNTDNYGKLHTTFEKLLKQDGEIYLAAKSYYFGVGGGISEFKDFFTIPENCCIAWKCNKTSHQDYSPDRPIVVMPSGIREQADSKDTEEPLESKWIPVAPGVISQKAANENKSLESPFS